MEKQSYSPADSAPRRSFLGVLIAAASALGAAVLGVPIVRSVLFPLEAQSSEAGVWSDLGPIDGYKNLTGPVSQPVNITQPDGWQLPTVTQTVYVVTGADKQPCVLSSICPHLGCTVQWHPEKDQFICPCHGGTYAADGQRISGPPARGMDQLATNIKDGRLQVKFQYFRQLLSTKETVE